MNILKSNLGRLRRHMKFKDRNITMVKHRMKKFHANSMQKRAVLTTQISEITDFKAKLL